MSIRGERQPNYGAYTPNQPGFGPTQTNIVGGFPPQAHIPAYPNGMPGVNPNYAQPTQPGAFYAPATTTPHAPGGYREPAQPSYEHGKDKQPWYKRKAIATLAAVGIVGAGVTGYVAPKIMQEFGVMQEKALSPSECYEQVTKDGGKWSRMGATSLNATESLQDPLFASVMDIDNATIINTYTPEQIELAQESMNLLVSQINAPESFKIEELARYRWGVYGEESGERSDGALGDQQNVCASFVTDDFEFYENKDPNYKRGDIPAQYRSQG